MAVRSKALAVAVLTVIVARSVVYSMMVSMNQGQIQVIALESALKAGAIALLAGLIASGMAQSPRSWSLVFGTLTVLLALVMVYLETLIRFPTILDKLRLLDFAVVAVQWLAVAVAAAFASFYATRSTNPIR